MYFRRMSNGIQELVRCKKYSRLVQVERVIYSTQWEGGGDEKMGIKWCKVLGRDTLKVF